MIVPGPCALRARAPTMLALLPVEDHGGAYQAARQLTGTTRQNIASSLRVGRQAQIGRKPASVGRRSVCRMSADLLGGAVAARAGPLLAPGAVLVPVPGAVPGAVLGLPGRCLTCYGPVRPGAARCYPCALHAECGAGSLASVVLPVAYAEKGGLHARRLWVYKSGRPEAAAAGQALALLLAAFLREHGPCAWRAAGWPGQGPTHAAVVPSCRGRAGPHPLRALAQPWLRLPWAGLAVGQGAREADRDLDPCRFRASRLDGARVLLLDDTWTTGASAQSAAMALRAAGACSVAVVVLGRHLARAAPPGAAAFSLASCARHAGA